MTVNASTHLCNNKNYMLVNVSKKNLAYIRYWRFSSTRNPITHESVLCIVFILWRRQERAIMKYKTSWLQHLRLFIYVPLFKISSLILHVSQWCILKYYGSNDYWMYIEVFFWIFNWHLTPEICSFSWALYSKYDNALLQTIVSRFL